MLHLFTCTSPESLVVYITLSWTLISNVAVSGVGERFGANYCGRRLGRGDCDTAAFGRQQSEWRLSGHYAEEQG